ncbi:hypothetical protein N7519_011576 [Penicillium mononematosum]|uniref:uncharacterized protein n=1 Tax=Penicillium mononematosum TaxID=268346 RepID=UPI002546F434|nr:uncharacterized protein N7519_011576 [Penicillium mononematosum]KAJ6181115.1 hypothetical protein N7519_011576 [Penicillium mononematosum]
MASKQALTQKSQTLPANPLPSSSTPQPAPTHAGSPVATQRSQSTALYGVRHYLQDRLIHVHYHGMASGLFWLRSYAREGSTPSVDMAVELHYDPFIEDLRSHFGYSHVLLWDQ